MRFDVLTLFPDMFQALTRFGITQRAFDQSLFQLKLWQLRDYSNNRWGTVDDRPFGGGPGMLMKPEPLALAIDAAKLEHSQATGVVPPVVYLSPQGESLNQAHVNAWVASPGMILLCGRYEGIDERLLLSRVDLEVSIGDFVVSGGELPAMLLMDALIRRLPGALGDEHSAEQDSFFNGLLDCPHYTRPQVFEGVEVPPVLLSGHHAKIEVWRAEQALAKTARCRPDLLKNRNK